MYHAAEKAKHPDKKITRRMTTARLERLTETGEMVRRKELFNGRNVWVYSRAKDE